MKKLLVFFFGSLFFFNAQASDYAKEKRWADQVVDSIIDGEEVWLSTGIKDQPEFLGIFTEAAEDKKRAAIVVHGSGVHPNWQQVILPLRVGLTEHGWSTLSIQMPVLANEAEYHEYSPLFEDVAPRFDTAIAHLKEQGAEKIVIVAHSLGSAMASYYLSKHQGDISSFVAIGMSAHGDDRMNQSETLKKVTIPVLDLYGSGDLENVLKSVDKRKASANVSGNKNYTQIVTQGANHFYDGKESELIETVSSWLEKY